MRNWLLIIRDELQLILKDKSILLTALVAPFLYAALVGSIYYEKEVADIPIGIVDLDHSSGTRKISNMIDATETVKVYSYYPDMESALKELKKLNIHAIVVFPSNFGKSLIHFEAPGIELILNNTRFLTSNEVNKAVQKVVLGVSYSVRLKYYLSEGFTLDEAKAKAQPVLPVIKAVYNPTNNYGDFLLPILLILILQQTLIISFGESLSHDQKEGKLNLSSNLKVFDRWRISLSKGLVYFLLYIIYFILFYTLIYKFYHLSSDGSFVYVFVFTLLFIIGVQLLTMLLASFFRDAVGWTEVMAFSTYPLFLISGYSWPIESMPFFMQWISKSLPTTPYYKAMTLLHVEGATWVNIQAEFVWMLLQIIAFGILLTLRFYWIKRMTTKLES